MGQVTKVVCMGDSITEGFGIDDPSNSYPSQLGKLLGDGYQVINKGVSGCCVTNATIDGDTVGFPYVQQPRYREALEEKGDIYIIVLGTNDAQDGMDDVLEVQYPEGNLTVYEPEFDKYYQRILDDVHKANPDAKVFIGIPAPVMQCIWRRHQEKYLQRLIPHYAPIAAANPGSILVDVHSGFMKLTQEERQALYQEDNLHPNEKGVYLIAQIMAEAIRANEIN